MRAMSTLELDLVRTLLCGRNEEDELLRQLDRSAVAERSNDGWVLEFHIPGVIRKSGKVSAVSEGHFEGIDGNILANVLLFVDENGDLYELEVYGYDHNVPRPFPDLSTLRVY
jgi:hypothetical protein